MKPFFLLLGLAGLSTGCHTMSNHESFSHHPPGGMSPTIIYYHEASQRLTEARRDGYLDNDQYADMLEKLHGDMRQIFVAETESHRPPTSVPMMRGAMPPGHPMPMRPPREREDN